MTKAELEKRFEKCWNEFCELDKKQGPRGAGKVKISARYSYCSLVSHSANATLFVL
jgi:hypothetical protein